MEKRETVKIECSHANGLMLTLFNRGRGEFGEPTVVRDGPGIRLNGPGNSGLMGGTNAGAEVSAAPGITEVDAEWWSRWVEQNKGKNPLFDQGIIRELQEKPYVVSHEETMAASRKLDSMLTEATKELKMPGIGAGKSVREILEQSKQEVRGALTDFAKMVSEKNRAMAEDIRQNGMLVIEKMEEDHREAREAFTEMLGNEVAVSDDNKSGQQG